jgi:Bacteriophage tail sheath protein
MPAQVSYPGVYVEEISSGVRTITGVATSITAFMGRALRGPVNEPVTITSPADFDRTFGGLGEKYPMSYAVRDFYANGGSQAIIVRLFNPWFRNDEQLKMALEAGKRVVEATAGASVEDAVNAAEQEAKKPENQVQPRVAKAVAAAARQAAGEQGATPAKVKEAADKAFKDLEKVASKNTALLTLGQETNALTLKAASPGSWGSALEATIDRKDISEDVGKQFQLAETDLFNLTVTDVATDRGEKFRNISLKESRRRLDRVLEAESALIRWSGPFPTDGLPTLPQDLDTKPVDAKATAPEAEPLPLDYFSYEEGLRALDKADLFNLLCIPPDKRGGWTGDIANVYQDAMKYCATARHAHRRSPRRVGRQPGNGG